MANPNTISGLDFVEPPEIRGAVAWMWKKPLSTIVSREPPISFFGDAMPANGTVYPEATVEARMYRLRVLNACNARFLNLQLNFDEGNHDSITLNPLTLAPTNAKGPTICIGTEGGFLCSRGMPFRQLK